ncbi:hypothetical protein LEP1GSC048_1050 [Leptospira santarosai serovar Shermani str. 1342KT]|nr:hypothetical protein LEP1GSC048_1050 [Leptospira santarosai serovar Shermani str. 1342KT]
MHSRLSIFANVFACWSKFGNRNSTTTSGSNGRLIWGG